MLKPRTAEELLFFCRETLRLEFPVDPINIDGGGSSSTTPTPESTGAGKRRIKRNPPGGNHTTPATNNRSEDVAIRVDDDDLTTVVAADVAEAVLAWGHPFRSIETGWTGAAAGGSYAVASGCCRRPGEVPRVSTTVVLCSSASGFFLKGTPNPLLRPGKFGRPFASDVSVQDIKWLKDQWDF